MSAVIHTFPADRPGSRETTDDLVEELSRAVGDEHTIGTPAGPRRLVSVRPDRHGGTNDLVVTGTTDPATRRLWIVAATVLLALGLAAIVGFTGPADADGEPAVAETVVVQSGDTVWGLAERVTPADGDVRATVTAIMDLNDLQTSSLRAGTVVALPEVQD